MTLFLEALREKHPCWTPSVDVYRTPSGWVLKCDLAGVRPQDVTVEICEKGIRIAGVRRDRIVEKGWRHYSMEISYCRFERSVEMPVKLEGAQITTDYSEGMLMVRVRTAGESQ